MSEHDASGAAPLLPLWRVERILYHADGLLVVDKPAGIAVHGGDETLKDDCVSRLGAWLEGQGRSKQLYVHQRLDLGTSGALFFLTDSSLNATYAEAMENHAISRKYLAVVSLNRPSPERNERGNGERFLRGGGGARAGRGARPTGRGTSSGGRFSRHGARGNSTGQVALNRASVRASGSADHAALLSHSGAALKPEGAIELYLLHERGHCRVVSENTVGAKRALTHYRIIKKTNTRALLELTLSTGRPHQIRASLAHLGASILGDTQYGGAPYARVMLHAASLSGAPLPREFVAPTPSEFADALLENLETVPKLRLAEVGDRLRDAVVLRAGLSKHTEAFRLVNGAPDGFPGCTIDAYGKFAVINPYEIEGDEDLWRVLAETLLELGFAGVYLKQRLRADLRKVDREQLAPDGPYLGERAPEHFVIAEHGMKLGIELHDGLSTGLFVDMRETRRKVAQLVQEKGTTRLLNLFCYTCSFSVAAALAGAHTTSVDLSGRALSRGRSNFELNGLDSAEHRFFKEDALKYLSKAIRRGEHYDFIVLDPPSFATVGKATFSVKEHYLSAARDCFALLAPGGQLLCVTNHLKTSPRAFVRMVDEAAQAAGRSLMSLRSLSSPSDCPEHSTGPFPSKAVLAQVS